MSSPYIRIVSDKIDFIEFKQNILFLKQPQHKASIFAELNLDDFLKIREFTELFSQKISSNEKLTISDYEKELFKIWPPIRAYPSSSTLVAKALMCNDIFDKLFQSNN